VFATHNVPPIIPKDVSLCVFRVAEEALNNIAKHSGAQSARVELTGDTGCLCLRILDKGKGFSKEHQPREGLGLLSMKERVRLVHGEFSVESKPQQGTEVEARIPLAVVRKRKCA